MAINAKDVGAFGVSFSRGMDQTWVNMYRREQGFLVEFFQNFEDRESDEDDEIIDEDTIISFELGEKVIAAAFENALLESWQTQYTEKDDGPDSELFWTIDVDDNNDADLLLLSGNRKLPPDDRMTPVIEAVRLCENRFMRCVKEWKE
ncbi:MAG: hypothetical protein E7427_03700 [Ruminococcaceae bacterium]|nr:hypothetical protein [Oscillospiraceae bacterium]